MASDARAFIWPGVICRRHYLGDRDKLANPRHQPEKITMLEVQKLFKANFFHTPTHVVSAPGRVELLGNHTDYNDGVVLSLAVDKYIQIASSPRTDGRVELVSSAFAG